MPNYYYAGTKYHNKKQDGFDSRKEARRHQELLLLERAGQIHGLKTQVEYILIPAQYIDGKCVERSCKYYADFVYLQDGQLVVEDAKGYRTKDYVIKRKLMLQKYGIRIREV